MQNIIRFIKIRVSTKIRNLLISIYFYIIVSFSFFSFSIVVVFFFVANVAEEKEEIDETNCFFLQVAAVIWITTVTATLESDSHGNWSNEKVNAKNFPVS